MTISRNELETFADSLSTARTVSGFDWSRSGAPLAFITYVHNSPILGVEFEAIEVHRDSEGLYVVRDSSSFNDCETSHRMEVAKAMDAASCYGNDVRHAIRVRD